MHWLKNREPIILKQTSDLPYIILENGVHICINNSFQEKITNKQKYLLEFEIPKNDIITQSVGYRLKKFPIILPFDCIRSLNNIIVNGEIRKKHKMSELSESNSVLIITSSYLIDNNIDDLDDLIYDFKFLIHYEEDDEFDYDKKQDYTFLWHSNWWQTTIIMADLLSSKKDRQYCWTRNIPNLEISCYGFKKQEDMDEFENALNFIGIEDFSCTWED